jgi:hypothetical protein
MAPIARAVAQTSGLEILDAAGWGTWALLWVRPDSPGFWLLLDLLTALGFALLLAGLPPRRKNLLWSLRWLLVPFLALLAGAVSPQAMGIAGVDREIALRLGLPLVAGLLLLLVLVRLAVRSEGGSGVNPPPVAEAGTIPFALLYTGAEQFHWCFQRAALLAIFAALPSAPVSAAYWATWAAVLLALPGLLLLQGGWARLWNLVALTSTAILFFYTRNFWLCWALHATIVLLAGPTLVRSALTNPVRALHLR